MTNDKKQKKKTLRHKQHELLVRFPSVPLRPNTNQLSVFWFPYWEVYLAWIRDLKRYNL